MDYGIRRQWQYFNSGFVRCTLDDFQVRLNCSRPPKSTFELESFSYACDSGIPQPACDISVWGWKSNGKVIKRVIRYPALNPAPVGSYIMNKTSFSREWHDIKSLGFSIARADNGGDMFGGLALDDIKYTITFGCP